MIKACTCSFGECIGPETCAAMGVTCKLADVSPYPQSKSLQPVLEQRGKEYGDYVVMCNKIQAIKEAYGAIGLLAPYQREALEMIATKIGRILTGNPNNEDSWRDIAGYATLVADRVKALSTPPSEVAQIPSGWEATRDPMVWRGPKGAYGGPIFHGSIHDLRKHLGLEGLK